MAASGLEINKDGVSLARGLAISVALLVVILIVSPLILSVIGWMLPLDWNKLNAIGQSYTGVSALVSAAALVGVVATIRLQDQQVAVSQQHALRDMHFSLNKMALEDPALAWATDATNDVNNESDYARWRMKVYVAMWFRYLEFGYSLRALPEDFIRAVSREMFATEPGREFWYSWSSAFMYPSGTDSSRKFMDIVQDEFEKV